MIPIEELQRAVYERLSSDLKVKVYDEVPDDAQAPYVVLMEQRHRSMDTKGANGWDATYEVNIWSTYRGTKEVAALANLVVESMKREAYPLEGYACFHMGFDSVEVTKAARGGVPGMLGVVRQKLKIHPTA